MYSTIKSVTRLGLAIGLGSLFYNLLLIEPLHAGKFGAAGARPSMGHVGGGGGRPAMGGGFPSTSRPMPNMSNGMGAMGVGNKPSLGNVTRPNMSAPATRPNFSNNSVGSNFHPSGGGRPSVKLPKPNTAGDAFHPSTRPLPNLKPTTRPSLPDAVGDRPNQLPDFANRPNFERPTISRPGNTKPSIGNVTRPFLPDTITRPTIGGDGIGRPNFSNGSNRPNIGNGIRIGNIHNAGTINIGNDIQIGSGNGNRFTNTIGNKGGNFATTLPAWDRPGYTKPGWGIGGPGSNNWAGNWHNHCIHHHYYWYNGCWNQGYWGSSWYRPIAWVAVGWGLQPITIGWGYGIAYYNPYYVVPANVAVPYDYSRPVVINNYITQQSNVADSSSEAASSLTEASQPLAKFDEGLQHFKLGNYQLALNIFDNVLRKLPGDPVVHEVRALTLFALGQYTPAAASLNSLLSSAPGMDWTTMSSLYGNPDDHTKQLRALEQYCRNNRKDAAAAFVLAYHDLVIGAKDRAINALKAVVRIQPQDSTAKRMLDALTATASSPASFSESDSETTDLVGTWRATTENLTVELTINEQSNFIWRATTKGQPTVELEGQLSADNDAIVLVNQKQGSMAGKVKSLGADEWKLKLEGAPYNDPGLDFKRVNAVR